ncbi:hypothetical protein KCU92_g360, partial [Aureobasidium melanogenum]
LSRHGRALIVAAAAIAVATSLLVSERGLFASERYRVSIGNSYRSEEKDVKDLHRLPRPIESLALVVDGNLRSHSAGFPTRCQQATTPPEHQIILAWPSKEIWSHKGNQKHLVLISLECLCLEGSSETKGGHGNSVGGVLSRGLHGTRVAGAAAGGAGGDGVGRSSSGDGAAANSGGGSHSLGVESVGGVGRVLGLNNSVQVVVETRTSVSVDDTTEMRGLTVEEAAASVTVVDTVGAVAADDAIVVLRIARAIVVGEANSSKSCNSEEGLGETHGCLVVFGGVMWVVVQSWTAESMALIYPRNISSSRVYCLSGTPLDDDRHHTADVKKHDILCQEGS